ncbi:hypothetical protein RKLH11_1730 [Rhodobacteraceae bacterium KLH11]|nr:hypothetical protein RKLH11_1730 [Rhodobacteraceae bacterium KLH11]
MARSVSLNSPVIRLGFGVESSRSSLLEIIAGSEVARMVSSINAEKLT